MKDIYLITNNITQQKYVGQTKQGYKARWRKHKCNYNCGVRTLISCAIHEYGASNFTITLLETVDDADADAREEYYIKRLHSHHSEGGYNMGWGGRNNPMNDSLVECRHSEACNKEVFKDKMRTPENIARLRHNNELISKPVAIFNIDGTLVREFISKREAIRFIGKADGRWIKRACEATERGEDFIYKGYIWKQL